MLRSFAQFLLQNDYASLAELEEASQATVLYGGRLGTALVELGALTLEQLDAALARHLDLPEIPAEWLAKPDAAARAALHVDLVKRHRAFPLQFEKRALHVGLVDPRNDGILDDIAFASGCAVVPYALGELRFAQLMQRVYGVAPSARFKNVLDERNRARARQIREAERARSAAERQRVTAGLEIGPLAADLAGAGDAYFVADDTPTSPALAPAARAPEPAAQAGPSPLPAIAQEPPLEIDTAPLANDRRAPRTPLERLEAVLAESSERSAVIDAAIEIAGRLAETAALLIVRDGVAAGLAGARAGSPLDVEAILLPLQDGSALAASHDARAPQRAIPAHALDKLLAKALRAAEDAELAVFPIAIAGRVVNLLVAQPQRGALAATAHAALGALAPQIAAAYERLIRAQKHKAQHAAATAAPGAARPAATAAIGALPLQKRVVRVPAKG